MSNDRSGGGHTGFPGRASLLTRHRAARYCARSFDGPMKTEKEREYPDSAFCADIHDLLTDPEFLRLEKSLSRPNLFGTIAASHLELWHSAFLRWVLDPQSHLGLRDFPLKCFFALALRPDVVGNAESTPSISMGEIEVADLTSVVFDTERRISVPVGDGSTETRRIDLIGESEHVTSYAAALNTIKLRVIVENKIEGKETNDQTQAYAAYAESNGEFDFQFLVFLTPDENQKPKSGQFTKITYQQLFDFVLTPCLEHPELPSESKYLLEQYVLNLGAPRKTKKPMANTRNKTCERIFRAHERVLNEIFGCLKQETIAIAASGGKKQFLAVTLDDLVRMGLLTLTDVLYSDHNKKHREASLKQESDGTVLIVFDGKKFDTPSGAAVVAAGTKAMNGWDYWLVKDAAGKGKGKLSDLRDQVGKSLGVFSES